MAKNKSTQVKLSHSDKVFFCIVYTVLAILSLIVLYPLVYIVSSSFSSAAAVRAGKVFLWPVDLSLEGYKAVLSNQSIGIGYRNTIFYTVVGTVLNVVATMMCAYPLAAKRLPYKGVFVFLFTFTMFFKGGMIPDYLLMRDLKLLDNPLVMILPGMISVYNMIIARSFIQSLPYELYEAAEMDGCSDIRYFITMVIPLSKACIAVIALYYAVSHWNSYFNAFLYLNDRQKYPLSLFLREILIANQMSEAMEVDSQMLESRQGLADLMKYALIVISSVPILCVYPFIQKYFVKGVMIGSLKG